MKRPRRPTRPTPSPALAAAARGAGDPGRDVERDSELVDPLATGTGRRRAKEGFRLLSRQFQEADDSQIRAVLDAILSAAGSGEEWAAKAVLNLEALIARAPVRDLESREDPEAVQAAERAIYALASRLGAALPDGACPWCGRAPEVVDASPARDAILGPP